MRGIKKRFVDAITGLLDDAFFERTEATEGYGSLRRDDFARRIGAAYDLRSQHVHTGYEFGGWIAADRLGSEVQLGSPVVPDKDLAKVLKWPPRFAGLERVIRYALLNHGAGSGLDLDGLLDSEPGMTGAGQG